MVVWVILVIVERKRKWMDVIDIVKRELRKFIED